MAKGAYCPECGKQTGQFNKGNYQCSREECGAVWWTAFDKPSAGKPRKGYKCSCCGNQTVHPVATVAGAKIWRCSVCATTIVSSVT